MTIPTPRVPTHTANTNVEVLLKTPWYRALKAPIVKTLQISGLNISGWAAHNRTLNFSVLESLPEKGKRLVYEKKCVYFVFVNPCDVLSEIVRCVFWPSKTSPQPQQILDQQLGCGFQVHKTLPQNRLSSVEAHETMGVNFINSKI